MTTRTHTLAHARTRQNADPEASDAAPSTPGAAATADVMTGGVWRLCLPEPRSFGDVVPDDASSLLEWRHDAMATVSRDNRSVCSSMRSISDTYANTHKQP